MKRATFGPVFLHLLCGLLPVFTAAALAQTDPATPPEELPATQATTQATTQPATEPAAEASDEPATEPVEPAPMSAARRALLDAWQQDVDALHEPIDLPMPVTSDSRSFTRHLGVTVPRSLILLNAVRIPGGENYGFAEAFHGSAAEYARYFWQMQFDQVFEHLETLAQRSEGRIRPRPFAQSLAGARIRLGDSRPLPQPPLIGGLVGDWFAQRLPDLSGPAWRDVQLQAQQLADIGNYSGVIVSGADADAAGRIAEALRTIDSRWIATIGDFGPEDLHLSGEALHARLDVQQVAACADQPCDLSLVNIALIDRLRSYHPHKSTWTIIDNRGLKLSRNALHRAYAMALTRGIRAIGTNSLPLPELADAQMEHLKEIHEWAHRMGGIYGTTEPIPTVGILYVHEQAMQQPSHRGRTLEAMFLCHAAGYPARIITPQELSRGLPESMKVVLLVGLERVSDNWIWHANLEDALRGYIERGGRIVIDERSIATVPAVKPGLELEAWFDQPVVDAPVHLLERNRRNIERLREALKDIPRPIGYSDDPTIWAIPHLAGNVEYVTVINYSAEPGRSTAEHVPPRTGQLNWTSPRPVYDVRAGRKLTSDEARQVDLTTESFQLYALPPSDPPPPSLKVEVDDRGCFTARVETGDVRGLPVEVTITFNGTSATLYRVTGEQFHLPLEIYDEPGEYVISATDLVTRQTGETRVVVPANGPSRPATVSPHLTRFAARKDVPLVIALTDHQHADQAIAGLAARLAAHLRNIGRDVHVVQASPDAERGVVVAEHPADQGTARPRWRTIDADLVLLGTPNDNVLIRDQALARLVPPRVEGPELRVTYSPFVGGRQVLNLLGDGVAALTVLVERVEREVR